MSNQAALLVWAPGVGNLHLLQENLRLMRRLRDKTEQDKEE